MLNSFRFETQRPSSLRHRVADTIRRAIITGQLKSGDRLREQDIADQMKVSRGPIREALSLLEREGLVVTYPYKETVVATLSAEEITEILLPIRYTLESFAVRKVIASLSADDMENLDGIVRRMELSADEQDLYDLVDLDVAFHRYFIKKAEQDMALSLWESIDLRIRLHFVNHGQEYGDLHQIPQEHRQLLDALRSRDLDTALAELRHHVFDLNN